MSAIQVWVFGVRPTFYFDKSLGIWNGIQWSCSGQKALTIENDETDWGRDEAHGGEDPRFRFVSYNWRLHDWLSLQHDTQLVSLMYRTHKSLPASCKISSLYVFDALSRAARQQVLKHNFPERHGSGNCATFLLKVAGVLEGLFQDMLVIGTAEAKVRSLEFTAKNSTGISRKITNSPLSLLSVSWRPVMPCSSVFNLIIEHILRTAPPYLSFWGSSSPDFFSQEKTKKIYDIWVKGATFPPDILSRLSDIIAGKDKGAYHDYLYAKYLYNYHPLCLLSLVRGAMLNQPLVCLMSEPRVNTSVTVDTSSKVQASPAVGMQPTEKPAGPIVDSQTTLLALLTQAAGQQIVCVPFSRPHGIWIQRLV